jgi:hypothetical protein
MTITAVYLLPDLQMENKRQHILRFNNGNRIWIVNLFTEARSIDGIEM